MSIISVSIGVRELMVLLILSLLVSASTPYGYWAESLSRPKSLDEWTLPFRTRIVPTLSCISFLLATWAISISDFYTQDYFDAMPGYTYAILWTTFVLFPSFAVVLTFQQFIRPKHYIRIEIAYQVVSLVTKATLGTILFVYILRDSSFTNFIIPSFESLETTITPTQAAALAACLAQAQG